KSGVVLKDQSVTITVIPSPIAADAAPATLEDTLTIATDFEGDTPHSVRVVEIAGVPKLVVTPDGGLPSRTYPVGTFSPAGSVTIANQGNAAAVVSFDGGGGVHVKPEGPTTIEAGTSVVVEVSVSPDVLADATPGTVGDAGTFLGILGSAACVPSTAF